jgi:hypothetical protein
MRKDDISHCPDCKVMPALMSIPFLSVGYCYECHCGVAVPFPPASSEELARAAWEKHIRERVTPPPSPRMRGIGEDENETSR